MDKNKIKNENNTHNGQDQELEDNNKKDDKFAELEEKVKDFEEKWKRALADYQNHEKWVREQRAEWIKSASRDLLLRILPILDTLILASEHSEEKSLAVSRDQFLSILKSEGVERIETVGKEFDPNLMEAINAQEGEENKVIKELRAGYMLFDKVLRAAQVTVGTGKIKN